MAASNARIVRPGDERHVELEEPDAGAGEKIKEKTRDIPFKLIQGWVIGYEPTDTAVILHTGDGGSTWVEQGDRSLRAGFNGLDISAVDAQTAWAALGSDTEGKILHTRDGGDSWMEQTLPQGVGPIKQIKGLSRKVVWA